MLLTGRVLRHRGRLSRSWRCGGGHGITEGVGVLAVVRLAGWCPGCPWLAFLPRFFSLVAPCFRSLPSQSHPLGVCYHALSVTITNVSPMPLSTASATAIAIASLSLPPLLLPLPLCHSLSLPVPPPFVSLRLSHLHYVIPLLSFPSLSSASRPPPRPPPPFAVAPPPPTTALHPTRNLGSSPPLGSPLA